MQWHPGWQFVVELLVAVGTLSLAAVTLFLVIRTSGIVEVSERALSVGLRPLLADPRPAGFSDTQQEQLLFGAPDRISPTVPWGRLWWDHLPDGSVPHFSVAFENIGSGPAAIVGWRTLSGGAARQRRFSREGVPQYPPGEMPGQGAAVSNGRRNRNAESERFLRCLDAIAGRLRVRCVQRGVGRLGCRSRAVFEAVR